MKIFTFKIIQLSSPTVSGGSAQLDLDNSAMTSILPRSPLPYQTPHIPTPLSPVQHPSFPRSPIASPIRKRVKLDLDPANSSADGGDGCGRTGHTPCARLHPWNVTRQSGN